MTKRVRCGSLGIRMIAGGVGEVISILPKGHFSGCLMASQLKEPLYDSDIPFPHNVKIQFRIEILFPHNANVQFQTEILYLHYVKAQFQNEIPFLHYVKV